jgi:SAM-dependent methyltransferase
VKGFLLTPRQRNTLNASTTNSQDDKKEPEPITSLIHKEVHYRFYGMNLFFDLSMGLFSSNSVDTGTDLLLRHLRKTVDASKIRTVLDAGCGTGVIGISLKKAHPHLLVTALDRDSLALEFTKRNADKNGTEIEVLPGLDVIPLQVTLEGFFPPQSSHSSAFITESAQSFPKRECQLIGNLKSFDLIATNIPAKAGRPVLKRFMKNGLSLLAPGGILGIVIVDTLRDTAAEIASECSAKTLYRFDGKRHTVYLFTAETTDKMRETESKIIMEAPSSPVIGREVAAGITDTSFPGPYLRNFQSFSTGDITYNLGTVFDLPGFDTVPFGAAMAAKSVKTIKTNSRTNGASNAKRINFCLTAYNPQQGHAVLCILSELFGINQNPVLHNDAQAEESFSNRSRVKDQHILVQLAGRDLLALYTSAWNIQGSFPQCEITINHLPSVEFLADELSAGRLRPADIMHMSPDPVPKVSWYEQLLSMINTSISSPGSSLHPRLPAEILLLTARSSVLSAFEHGIPGYAKKLSKKSRGFKSLQYQSLYYDNTLF